MSEVRRKISLPFLLLLLFTLTVAAQDYSARQGCRRGVLLPTTRSHRSQSAPMQAGGDFYHGDRRQLVVLAEFRDQPFQGDVATALATWDKIFNAVDYHEGSYAGSVHDYFYAQSYGKFNLVFDPIHVLLPDSAKKYRSTAEHDEYSQYLVDDIVDTLQTLDIDWSQYDWNDNGFVNQLLIIYAGKGMNADGGSNTIWPHQWWLSMHLKNPDNNLEGYRGYRTVTHGDKQFIIDCYCCVQEVVNTSSVKTSFGTICHEYTHCFGFPDFYNGSTKYVGEWDLMDYGNYGNYGYCPTSYSAHERWLMGWLEPVELTDATEVCNMPALTDEPQAYLIRNDGYADEYYIVENRQRQGWDSNLSGSGLTVFHVDYDEEIWAGLKDMPNSSKLKRYTIFPANNQSSVYKSGGWPYPYQTNDSLTNTSKPAATLIHANTDGKKLMNKSLLDMKVENGLASFRFTVPLPTGIEERKAEGSPQVLYRLGPIGILRYPNGVIQKVIMK